MNRIILVHVSQPETLQRRRRLHHVITHARCADGDRTLKELVGCQRIEGAVEDLVRLIPLSLQHPDFVLRVTIMHLFTLTDDALTAGDFLALNRFTLVLLECARAHRTFLDSAEVSHLPFCDLVWQHVVCAWNLRLNDAPLRIIR